MTTTLCSSGAVKLKAGANRPDDDTTITADNYTTFINQAEQFINVGTQYDWVTNYASLPTTTKQILEDAASSKAAMAVINYDMSNYSSQTEAQVMLDVNYAILVDCMNLLSDDKYRTFTKQAS